MPKIVEPADEVPFAPIGAMAHQVRLAERRADLVTKIGFILSSSNSIVLEVGCGHGHFLTAYAQAHRDQCCVGVDIASDRVGRAERKRQHAQLTNLHFVRADIREFVKALPVTPVITRVFVLFPDPWPKSRHHKHRVMQAEFLASLARRMTGDACLFFRTDYEPYYAAARQVVSSHPGWLLADDPWPFECMTVFQRRATQIYSLVARLAPPGR